MYAGVDIGGTKTLVAALDDDGKIVEKIKFETPENYAEFVDKLRDTVASLSSQEFKAGAVAIPGKVDRAHGVGLYFGNLAWTHVPIQADAEKIFRCPILVENDANLGGLSESMVLPPNQRVLYITIGTGIGTAFIADQKIMPELADSEGGQMLLEYRGKRQRWEDFASGRAIVERFGKKAADITDEKTWQRIAHDLSLGILEIMAIFQPEVIIVGGGVGRYFDYFKTFLQSEISQYHNPLIAMPIFRQADHPNEAVLYGCYELAKGQYGTNP